MRLIPLGGKHGKGRFAKVDDADFDRVNQYKWFLQKIGYVEYAVVDIIEDGKRKYVYMHRLILDKELSGNQRVDHRDGDGLNNQRENLRACTGSQNCINKGKNKNNTSGYKGVILHKGDKRKKKWKAQIKVDRKVIVVGYFLTKEEAAKAYDEAALKYFGEFAKTNF